MVKSQNLLVLSLFVMANGIQAIKLLSRADWQDSATNLPAELAEPKTSSADQQTQAKTSDSDLASESESEMSIEKKQSWIVNFFNQNEN